MSTHILIADKFPEEQIGEMGELGCRVVYSPQLKEDALLGVLQKEQPDILIVRSTPVNGEMIRSNTRLSLIIRAGSGYDTIDVAAASERSVYVSNCPGKNAVAVAELAFGLILSIDRHIPDNVVQLREGKWNKKEFSKARGLAGRILGIIGVGRIGKEVIKRAQSFNMQVIAWSRSLTKEKARILGIGYCGSIEELAEKADVISVHIAFVEETNKLIGDDFFKRVKQGAYFINTSRSEVVDEAALFRAVEAKRLHVGLDVFQGEPLLKEGEFTSSLAGHPRVYGTHHIGASTEQAQQAVACEAVRIVREYLTSGRVLNCVNLLVRTPARWMLSVHHRNRVGILAGILDVIRDAGINVEIMENLIFSGDEGACARIQLDGKLSTDSLEAIRNSSNDIFAVQQVELGNEVG